jgi:hypothetical protein
MPQGMGVRVPPRADFLLADRFRATRKPMTVDRLSGLRLTLQHRVPTDLERSNFTPGYFRLDRQPASSKLRHHTDTFPLALKCQQQTPPLTKLVDSNVSSIPVGDVTQKLVRNSMRGQDGAQVFESFPLPVRVGFLFPLEKISPPMREREGGEVPRSAIFYRGSFSPACFARARWRPSKVRNSLAPR